MSVLIHANVEVKWWVHGAREHLLFFSSDLILERPESKYSLPYPGIVGRIWQGKKQQKQSKEAGQEPTKIK